MIILFTDVFPQSRNATVRGIIYDQDRQPLDMVNIGLKDYPIGTSSNREGKFLLRIPAEKDVVILFSSLGYATYSDTLRAEADGDIFLEISLTATDLKLAEIVVTENRRNGGNITRIDPRYIDIIPDAATGGVEALIKTLPGVSANNELSSQYTVRGGNFDENMVYVNDIEIYRPFLVRAGQQEGLSFINSDMVSTIDFSAGGFDARYGDKMASVLDIKYRKPSIFRGSASMSMLGAKANFKDVALKGRLAHITG
ncbi:MAG: carboxypeptidase-like regulatory domain-containing protein, partial [Mariniphaga sp.]|nr:carboxypeptidase-like regulatory domain-containing protein [Mariniphaga sp.]